MRGGHHVGTVEIIPVHVAGSMPKEKTPCRWSD